MRGSFPMKDIYNSPTLQRPVTYISYTTGTEYILLVLYCLVKDKYEEKTKIAAALVMVCASVVDLRVPSCCRSSWPPHRLSPIGPLLRTCSRCHLLPVASPSSPSRNKKRPSHLRFWSEKQTFSRMVSSIRLFPARRLSVSLLLCRPVQPQRCPAAAA